MDKIPFPFYQPKNKAIITRHDDRYFSFRTLESKSQPTRFVYPLERDEERLDSSRGGGLCSIFIEDGSVQESSVIKNRVEKRKYARSMAESTAEQHATLKSLAMATCIAFLSYSL